MWQTFLEERGLISDRKTILCAQGISLNVDLGLSEVVDKVFDAVVLPGGQPGSDSLASDERVGEILRRHESDGRVIGAICAAPLAIKRHGIGRGGVLTSYPSVREELTGAGYVYSEDRVSVCKNMITSRGPGTAFDFVLEIVRCLVGDGQAISIRRDMLI